MVQEAVSWFKDKGSKTPRLQVEVVPIGGEALGGVAVGDASKSVIPKIEMYGVPQEKIVELIGTAGGTIVDIRENQDAGPHWLGYRYCVTKEPDSTDAGYQLSVRRIREIIRTSMPTDATVIVISRGDEELLNLGGRQAWHFPQNKDGIYAGHYPADSAEAIAHLNELQKKGARFLVFPNTALWWLDHYTGFKKHLDEKHRAIWADRNCVIYRLCSDAAPE